MRRRDFFAVLGSGLAVRLAAQGADMPQEIGAWIHINSKGVVSVFCGKCEMGQNIRTSLAQAVAEELRAPIDNVRMVMGDTALTPYDRGTFSSRTTPFMAPQLRKAAAAAREALVELAAKKWKVEHQSLKAEDGRVSDTGGRSISFGELTQGRKILKTISPHVELRPASDWTVAGSSVPKTGARQFVTGRHVFPSDFARSGMVFGKILRPPAYGAELVSLDTTKAESLPDVRVIRDGDFVGVTAPYSHAAQAALDALRPEWKHSPQESSRDFIANIKARCSPGASQHAAGSIAEGLGAALQKEFRSAYTLPFIAHAPLEPRAAVAEQRDGKLTVWTGTTSPFGMRKELALLFQMPETQIRVIVPDVGSGYCGKSRSEAAIEAARMARAVDRPVKLVWTREEEFTWAWFRPAGLIEITSGARKDGRLTAWEFHNYNSGNQAIRTPYEVPHQLIEFHRGKGPLRQGSYRALAAIANFFARETHLDEIAVSLGIDPLELRLLNLKDERLRTAFLAAASRFGWGERKPAAHRGFGIAGGFEKGAYVATCAEVIAHGTDLKVARVVTAYDCGAVINPNHIKNQIEGGTMMAIGGALFESIEAQDGKILNPRFSQYRVPRFSDAPAIEAVPIDRKDLPSFGAGETPMCAVAPAIGNAIFNATGARLRSLPMKLA